MDQKKGNMYGWIDKTVNPLAGKCGHLCKYCYVEDLKERYPSHMNKYSGEPRISEAGLQQINGKNKVIFIVSMNDLFAENVPAKVINKVLDRCNKYDNTYLFQTKNPGRMLEFETCFPKETVICTTIESNRFYQDIMNNCPKPEDRAIAMSVLAKSGFKTYVTCEPLLDFNLDEMSYLIETCNPSQVNLGFDSKRHNMPEPTKEKTLELISRLKEFTNVDIKTNAKRVLK